MSHLHQVPAADPEAATRDRTSNSLAPSVAAVALLVAALPAVSSPVVAVAAGVGIVSTALAVASPRWRPVARAPVRGTTGDGYRDWTSTRPSSRTETR